MFFNRLIDILIFSFDLSVPAEWWESFDRCPSSKGIFIYSYRFMFDKKVWKIELI